MFVVCLVVAGGLAVPNWVSRVRPMPRVEAITKVAVTSCLVLAAIVGDAVPPGARPWFVAALVGCLLGDIALLDAVDQFIGGLVAFLVGHMLFVVGALVIGVSADRALPAVIVLAVALGVVAPPVVRASGKLAPAVVAYLTVISAMGVVMAMTGRAWLTLGAAMFVMSDATLAWNRFVRPRRFGPLAVMMTYHAALGALVVGLGR